MDEGAGFIEAILAAPSDDVPRLVYSDWLEERGEGDRAGFIRAQCELAPLRYDDDRVSALQAREYRLLSRHFAAWRSGYNCVRFHRGFIEELQFWRPEDFIEAGPELFARHPVRDVEIGSQDDQPWWGQAVAACPHLRRVEVLRLTQQRCHITYFTDFLAILSSPHLTSLTALDASGGHDYGDNGLLELLGVPERTLLGRSDDGLLPSLRRLRVLSLNEMGLTDAGVRALAESPLAHTLTHLDLSENRCITADGIRALIDSALWARLEELDLGRLYSRDGAALQLVVNALPRSRIRKLGLSGALDGDARRLDLAEAFASAPSWGCLEALDLSWNSLGGEGVRMLTECPHLTGLRWLDLAWNGMAQGDIERLAGCSYLAGLTSFRVANPDLTDSGLVALAESPYLTRLVYLDVDDSRVRETGVVAFARSPNASRLRVWVLPCVVGDPGLLALAKSPNLGQLTTLLFMGTARAGEGSAPTDVGSIALAQSANLSNLAVLDCYWQEVSEAGLRTLLESERLAWHGKSDLQHHSPELKQAYQKRFHDFSSFDLFGVRPEPLFPWASWA